jgi:siroheme synthase (precorrin-2 oxidase/ferrochelatase)
VLTVTRRVVRVLVPAAGAGPRLRVMVRVKTKSMLTMTGQRMLQKMKRWGGFDHSPG